MNGCAVTLCVQDGISHCSRGSREVAPWCDVSSLAAPTIGAVTAVLLTTGRLQCGQPACNGTPGRVDNAPIYSYYERVNRSKDRLIPIEVAILSAALALRQEGTDEFHGFSIGKRLEEASASRSIVGHGTLYKALHRLELRGYLVSHWEESQVEHRARGARRRLYRLTTEGQAALAAAHTGGSVKTFVERAALS
jgi:PadR family transcriptional regulator PadR